MRLDVLFVQHITRSGMRRYNNWVLVFFSYFVQRPDESFKILWVADILFPVGRNHKILMLFQTAVFPGLLRLLSWEGTYEALQTWGCRS